MEKLKIITLAGNPNVGKSTIFNYITGLRQHTGNWSGKTVSNAKGRFIYKQEEYEIIDIPGTYSLNPQSKDEEVARDYMCFGKSDATVIVCDATSLERNLALVLQTIELKENVIVCVNLLDEAKKKGINVDLKILEKELGVYVVGTNAREGKGIKEFLEKIKISTNGKGAFGNKFEYEENIEKAINTIEKELDNLDFKGIKKRFVAIKLLQNERELISKIEEYVKINFYKQEKILQAIKSAKYYLEKENIKQNDLEEKIYENIYKHCERICEKVYKIKKENYYEKDIKLDKILTSKKYGIPIMLLLLSFIFWITITGANYPSQLISSGLFYFEENLKDLFLYLNFPAWLISFLIDGIYKVVAWVISVMLPPMAIFFPMFTLLEDFGYLPRVAFNLDNAFKKCNACGKQALTMAMGFGCNAVGVTGCRIIDSPRERLIAIITNNFVPCNGRLAKLIKKKKACINLYILI